MANKEFLEIFPLYKKFQTGWKFNPRSRYTFITEGNVPKPAIHMYCNVCDSEQTFNMANNYYDSENNQIEPIHNKVKEIRYICSACEQGLRVFLIYFGLEDIADEDDKMIYLEKVGQIPAWSIAMDKNLESMLGKHATYYKRGLICESQSYGIGAYAYFRRITEDIIDELLDSVEDLLEGQEKIKYSEALAKTKTTRITQEKLDIVKDILPASLRPNGVNPLDALHSALSEGLHAETDEDCLKYAEAIKQVLIYLVNQIIRQKEESRAFTDGMKKLLEKKTRQN